MSDDFLKDSVLFEQRIGVELGVASVTPRRAEEAIRRLLPEERARAQRFTHDEARQHHLVGRALARAMLGDLGEIAFEAGPHGKPRAPGGPEFNVSHSHGLAVCAVVRDGSAPVGVDVEWPERRSDFEAIMGRYFAATEETSIASADAPRRAFFELWTLKEALLKATGKGLTTPLSSIVFERKSGQWELFEGLEGPWSFARLELGSEESPHLVAIAAPCAEIVVERSTPLGSDEE